MKQNLILICGVVCLSIFTGCKQADGPVAPALKEQTKRTVLMYLFQDTNLSGALTDNINELEVGWDPQINGTMLVYVDASTRMTQFDGKPVLLEITRDTTNLIVSKIVKVYPDVDATRADVFRSIQQDVIAMYPADSYGLIISGHGSGFFVQEPTAKGLSGSDRWGNNFLDIDVIAKNLPVHYDYIVFDACLMGETTTLYQLRNATDFIVASVEVSPGDGFAYKSDLKSLFAQPKADLFTFTRSTSAYYRDESKQALDTNQYQTIGVYRMSAMEKLAKVTNKALATLDLSYEQLRQEFEAIRADSVFEVSTSMYYPRDTTTSRKPMYYDMWLFEMVLRSHNKVELAQELNDAIFDVVIQRHFATPELFRESNPSYVKRTANLSFFLPNKLDEALRTQSDAFYRRFEWSSAAGVSTKWD